MRRTSPPARRMSNWTLRPSAHPSSRSPRRRAETRICPSSPSASPMSTAMRRIRSGCCARAASGHAAAAPPSSVMKLRRLIRSPRRRLHRQVGRLLAPKDAIDVTCREPGLLDLINAVGYEPAGGYEETKGINRGQTESRRQRDDRLAKYNGGEIRQHNHAAVRLPRKRLDRAFHGDAFWLGVIAQHNGRDLNPQR